MLVRHSTTNIPSGWDCDIAKHIVTSTSATSTLCILTVDYRLQAFETPANRWDPTSRLSWIFQNCVGSHAAHATDDDRSRRSILRSHSPARGCFGLLIRSSSPVQFEDPLFAKTDLEPIFAGMVSVVAIQDCLLLY